MLGPTTALLTDGFEVVSSPEVRPVRVRLPSTTMSLNP